jgi:hypothetical protein
MVSIDRGRYCTSPSGAGRHRAGERGMVWGGAQRLCGTLQLGVGSDERADGLPPARWPPRSLVPVRAALTIAV